MLCSAIPASALDEDEDEDEDEVDGETRDDERTGTRYNVRRYTALPLSHHSTSPQYSWFHVIFAMGAMYVAVLLTDWYVLRLDECPTGVHAARNRNVVKTEHGGGDDDVYIGRSEVAMWVRVVSSWVCMLLYMWSLIAPVLMPDRYVTFSIFSRQDLTKAPVCSMICSVLYTQLDVPVGECMSSTWTLRPRLFDDANACVW